MIKKCPHCGKQKGEAEPYQTGPDTIPGQWIVVCNYNKGGCGASGGVRNSKEEAIAAYNMRGGRP